MQEALPINSGSRLLAAASSPRLDVSGRIEATVTGPIGVETRTGKRFFGAGADRNARAGAAAIGQESEPIPLGDELELWSAGAVFHAAVSVSWLRRSA
jgi:hypothetical protein